MTTRGPVRPDLLVLAASDAHWARSNDAERFAKESVAEGDRSSELIWWARRGLHREVAVELRQLAGRIGAR